MALVFPDQWIWDFWIVKDKQDYHVFYLQAPKSLGNETLRHWNTSIGHAVSQDLKSWSVLPDALSPSTHPDAFDNYTTWTGSIIQAHDRWYMFYTGSMKQDKGLVQRIGYATSADLISWTKNPGNPVIQADPTWYELLDRDLWHDQAWRDPWIFRHPESGKFHALITARVNHGPPDGRGVIGHAVSADLEEWEVQPPLTESGKFGQMEVPQLVSIGERYYLLFSVQDTTYSQQYMQRLESGPWYGSHYLVSDNPLGPFEVLGDEFLVGDQAGTRYSAKILQGPNQEWVLLAFKNYAPDGSFVGELADPIPVGVGSDGRLFLKPA
ncbi:MAG: family 43 glycosylhydrolase [candidate division Zixibacteria bacterium]|nr:family 43 glycosylhydrolase [Gammaproteobacteria bacterium]NIX54347.1 family 43 glycosylhydrolase [candidate division Zixibacteria bacterium]